MRVTEHIKTDGDASVLDIASGNLRFERFLSEEDRGFTKAYALDNCNELLEAIGPKTMDIVRIKIDILELLEEASSFSALGIPACDLTACFGFMHHVPTFSLRKRLLKAMIASTSANGICAVSFWQIRHDERLIRKAKQIEERASKMGIEVLEEGDRLLGWQDDTEALRYCHDFSDAETDELRAFSESLGARIIDDFNADGRTGDMNRYLVMQVP